MGIDIPSWITAGTAPQWGLFFLGFVAFLRYVVIPWRQQDLSSMDRLYQAVKTELDLMRTRLDICERNCDERDKKILGLERQNTAREISFARILMDKLGKDDPTIAEMLISLEKTMLRIEAEEDGK